jgi:hypothetical protein
VSGLGIRLHTDEDVDPDLAVQLTRLGYDVLSCHAARNDNQSLSDEWQLEYAVSLQRTIFTYNVVHFYELDARWRGVGREHHGIVVSAQLPISELVRRTKQHLDTFSASYHYNLLLHLAP